MFGLKKILKRRRLSVAEEAELRKWSFNEAQKYIMYSQSHEVPVHQNICLEETLELANLFTEWLLSGHFQFEKLRNHKTQ